MNFEINEKGVMNPVSTFNELTNNNVMNIRLDYPDVIQNINISDREIWVEFVKMYSGKTMTIYDKVEDVHTYTLDDNPKGTIIMFKVYFVKSGEEPIITSGVPIQIGVMEPNSNDVLPNYTINQKIINRAFCDYAIVGNILSFYSVTGAKLAEQKFDVVTQGEFLREVLNIQETKVDKIPDKGLSTEDYTTNEKNKLANAYQKPGIGIPKTDLETAVQTSLSKADSALQNVPDATTTVKGISLLGATNGAARYGQKSDVGLGNVQNVDTTNASNISTGTMSPARILQDANNRFFTDVERNKLAGMSVFVLNITFSAALKGKTFTVTGGGMTAYSDTVPDSLAVVVPVPTANTTYIITCDMYKKTVTTGSYYGIYYVYVDNVSRVLAENSWAQIAAVAGSGNAQSYWNIGDEINITLTGGEVLTLQIYDFNHDDLTSGGKAGITFGMKNLMATTRRMEATNTNANSFTGSEMYGWLRDTLLPSLPADLQTVIKNVDKKTSAGSQSSTIKTESMKVFLFSEIECFGTLAYSFEGEGTQYPIFTDANSRIKRLTNGSGSATVWWERSPYATNSTTFCNVASSGNAISNDASIARGVCFGFCV